MKSKQKECFLCQTPCENCCPHCELIYFCSDEHFKLHRVTIKEEEQVRGHLQFTFIN